MQRTGLADRLWTVFGGKVWQVRKRWLAFDSTNGVSPAAGQEEDEAGEKQTAWSNIVTFGGHQHASVGCKRSRGLS